MSFGEYLKQLRLNKGLSLRETAKRSEMSSSYLSQLENGHNTNPNTDIIMKLSSTLDADYFDLIKETENFKGIFNEAVQEQTNELLENYNRGREIAGLTIYKEHTFELEELFSEGTKLTNGGKLLTEVEKKKILTLIDTILN